MANDREFQEINVLIPGYSIEDLPSDLDEQNASSLLNAFAVAWHPWLLTVAAGIPEFKQAEATDLPTGKHIVLIPKCSEDWLGHEWESHFEDTLSVVLHDCSERSEYVSKIGEHFGVGRTPLSPDLLDQFYALGTCHLQVMLLSRRMHHFVDPDTYLLEAEALAAAESALKGDDEEARDHLRRCFECLQDCREQFYPVDCFLIDVCLPSDQTTAEELRELIVNNSALSLICSGHELCRHTSADPEFETTIVNAVADKRLSLLTGHKDELRTSLNSLSTLYSDLQDQPAWLKAIAKESGLHWARRRFGMTSFLPAVLSHFGFASALHVVLDDGLYPDREFGQLTWQAPDGTVIPAVSRIPLAIDGATSFQRFADRLTESMQEDTNAVMLLARLPAEHTPWLSDLKTASSFAPVLGQFVTLTDYIDQSGDQSHPTKFDEGEYLSPFLIQSSVLKTESPVSSPARLSQARAHIEAVAALDAIAAVLKPKAMTETDVAAIERRLNAEEATRISLDPKEDSVDQQAQRLAEITEDISTATAAAGEQLASFVPSQRDSTKGRLLCNSLPWNRHTFIIWPGELKLPANARAIRGAWTQQEQTFVSAELPPGGFLWLHEARSSDDEIKPVKSKGKPLAEHLLLRNAYFEVDLSETTGGIAAVRFHNQRANRVSQQVAFRYESSKTVKLDDEEFVTPYAAARLVSTRVVQPGPYAGSVETTCAIHDVVTDEVMATFRQTFIVQRDSTHLKLRIDFDDLPQPPTGNPWMTYLASRFAWDNESASITRSMLGQASGFRMERFEAPDYIEVADNDQRLLIVPHGRPYHRRSGRRMLDSLLIVDGESESSFEFTMDFDQPLPMRTVLDVSHPVVSVPTRGIPKSPASGWILGISARNVVAARIRVAEMTDDLSNSTDDSSDTSGRAVIMVLQETEGRSARCGIKTARMPKAARLRRPDGSTVQELTVSDDGIVVDFAAFQLKEVELTF